MKKIYLVFFAILILGLIIAGYFIYLFSRNGDNINPEKKEVIKEQEAWFKNERVTYYDLGQTSAKIGNIYVLITGFADSGEPKLVEGQYLIFDSKLGNKNYSGFYEVNFVTVPTDYIKNSVKSTRAIVDKKWTAVSTGIIVNQPEVFADKDIDPIRPQIPGWCDNSQIQTWFFAGMVSKNDKKEALTKNLYIFVTGFVGENIPKIVEGQKNIVDSIPSEKDYSSYTNIKYVKVPTDYVADSIKSHEEIIKNGYEIIDSKIFVNAPVEQYSSKEKVSLNYRNISSHSIVVKINGEEIKTEQNVKTQKIYSLFLSNKF